MRDRDYVGPGVSESGWDYGGGRGACGLEWACQGRHVRGRTRERLRVGVGEEEGQSREGTRTDGMKGCGRGGVI
jgi:hypothetical protein